MSRRIDELLAAQWEAQGITPAPPSDDAEFLRRVSLDLNGVTPAVATVRAFLDDSRESKRRELIDSLLASPGYARHLAITWRKILLPDGLSRENFAGAAALESWLRQQFQQNLRYDNFVAEFLVARGQDGQGPGIYYRQLELAPEKLAASTSRIFLGTQIQCAQCHDHPFDHWKQTDFWGYAAFFARLESNQEGNALAILDRRDGEVMLPDTQQVVAPDFPGGDREYQDDGGTRRQQLAIWMASRDNPYLARVAVNRVWAQLFGRGLVDPVDDFGPLNPPSHPQLLDELEQFFIATRFDLRNLYRTLANTRAYQLSSAGGPADGQRAQFASMALKTLTPEQLYDSYQRNVLRERPQTPLAGPNGQPLPAGGRLEFLLSMQSPARSPLDYEGGLPQALRMMNGPEISRATNPSNGGLLVALEAPFLTPRQQVETLYLATLARFPTPAERQRAETHLQSRGTGEAPGQPGPSDTRQLGLSDVLWSLLNSAEFCLNH